MMDCQRLSTCQLNPVNKLSIICPNRWNYRETTLTSSKWMVSMQDEQSWIGHQVQLHLKTKRRGRKKPWMTTWEEKFLVSKWKLTQWCVYIYSYKIVECYVNFINSKFHKCLHTLQNYPSSTTFVHVMVDIKYSRTLSQHEYYFLLQQNSAPFKKKKAKNKYQDWHHYSDF